MDHILARIKGVKLEELKTRLRSDAEKHAEHGLVLRHVWKNEDDPNEILFIFTTPDLNRARKFIEMSHSLARKENPKAILPEIIFLKGE